MINFLWNLKIFFYNILIYYSFNCDESEFDNDDDDDDDGDNKRLAIFFIFFFIAQQRQN